MKKFYPVFLLLLLSFRLTAQEIRLSDSRIFFPSGKYKIDEKKAQEVKRLFDSLKKNNGLTIEIEGYTDNVGGYESNFTLSERRAVAVKEWLIRTGVPANAIQRVEGFGPDNPEGDNHTESGKAANRRVKISFKIAATQIVGPQYETGDILDLYRQLETPLQKFCINQSHDTVLRCAKGTIIIIKANSLIMPPGCGSGCVSFGVREDFLKSEMILDNLTTTSNGAIIETQGMVYTEARDCKGNKLELQKDIVIMQPTDSVRAGSKIFEGKRTHDDVMNWTLSNNSALSGISLNQLDDCGGWVCAVLKGLPCYNCPFLFCRVGRVGKAVGGLFSKNRREKNQKFRECLVQLETQENTRKAASTFNPSKNYKLASDSLMPSSCAGIAALFDKYGVKDAEGLIKAINKPLMDSFKVTTIDQLRDTLYKIKTRNIEMDYLDKKISFDDLKYYMYNRSQLGWANVDYFTTIPDSRKAMLRVNIPPLINTDCKLIFKNRRIVLPGTKSESHFEFLGVPKGEPATIMAIRYKDGRPYLATKEIIISESNFDVEFRLLTLDELKAELKRLDL